MKALGVVVGVFIAWCLVAFIVMYQQHVGQTYDPTFGGVGAWFSDPAKSDAEAAWIGSAIMYGVFVSLGVGLVYWFKNRTIKVVVVSEPSKAIDVASGTPPIRPSGYSKADVDARAAYDGAEQR